MKDTTLPQKTKIAIIDIINPFAWQSWKNSEGFVFNAIKGVSYYFIYKMIRNKK